MKRLHLYFVTIFSALTISYALSSCDNDDPKSWPDICYSPITFDISCVNSQGLDLLDAETEGNIVDDDIKILYDGEWYPLRECPWPELTGRSFALWHSPYITTVKAPDGAMTNTIRIGEIDGGENVTTDITLSIGDRSFNLRVTNSVKPGTIKIKRHFYLDDKKTDNNWGFYRIIL